MLCGSEDGVLAEKAAQRPHARQCQRADHERPIRHRHFLSQCAHLPDVLLVVHRVNHRASAKEQQCLEERVRGEMEHARFGSGQTHAHDHVAELRECRVSEDAFDVVLLDGDERGQQRGKSTDPRNHGQRIRRKDEEHAAQHVNAGGHHRRGVDQRADGRRAFHRVGQPDVQRKLRGLAHRAAEDQQASEGRCAAEQSGIRCELLLNR